MFQIVVQLIVSTCVVLATYYRDDIRRHLTDLLTLTSRPSSSFSGHAPLSPRRRRSRDVIELRHRHDVLVNGVVKLYNRRRRRFVAVAPRDDVTVTSRQGDVMAVPGRRRRHLTRSVHFSNQISCSSCEYADVAFFLQYFDAVGWVI